jgi:hypothetical protein
VKATNTTHQSSFEIVREKIKKKQCVRELFHDSTPTHTVLARLLDVRERERAAIEFFKFLVLIAIELEL